MFTKASGTASACFIALFIRSPSSCCISCSSSLVTRPLLCRWHAWRRIARRHARTAHSSPPAAPQTRRPASQPACRCGLFPRRWRRSAPRLVVESREHSCSTFFLRERGLNVPQSPEQPPRAYVAEVVALAKVFCLGLRQQRSNLFCRLLAQLPAHDFAGLVLGDSRQRFAFLNARAPLLQLHLLEYPLQVV